MAILIVIMPMLIVIELIIGVILVVAWGYNDLMRELSRRPCQGPAEPDDDDGDDDGGMHTAETVRGAPAYVQHTGPDERALPDHNVSPASS